MPRPGLTPALAAEPQDALESSIDAALAEALGTDVAAVEAADTEAAPAGSHDPLAPSRATARRRCARPRRPDARGKRTRGHWKRRARSTSPPLTPGTRLVQLGAFDDEAGARAEWASLQVRFGDLIAGEGAGAAGGAERRAHLRSAARPGFEDEDDARRFCSALLAENATCIPVTHRAMSPARRSSAALGPAARPSERAFFRDADPWGFILFARNVETPDQLRRLTADLRDAVGRDAPVFVDQEGGRVQRLRAPHWREWAPPLDTVRAAGAGRAARDAAARPA